MQTAQQSSIRACEALADIKRARARQQEMELRNQEKRKIPISAHSQMYDQMRSALYDTQKSVEVSKIFSYIEVLSTFTKTP